MTRAGRAAGIGALALAALAAACASAGGGPEGERRPADPGRVEVGNHSTLNVVVYVHYGGQRFRLGEATALGAANLSLPPAIAGGAVRVRFQLDPIGPPTGFLSDAFVLTQGDVVVIHVQPNIRQSTVSIR